MFLTMSQIDVVPSSGFTLCPHWWYAPLLLFNRFIIPRLRAVVNRLAARGTDGQGLQISTGRPPTQSHPPARKHHPIRQRPSMPYLFTCCPGRDTPPSGKQNHLMGCKIPSYTLAKRGGASRCTKRDGQGNAVKAACYNGIGSNLTLWYCRSILMGFLAINEHPVHILNTLPFPDAGQLTYGLPINAIPSRPVKAQGVIVLACLQYQALCN